MLEAKTVRSLWRVLIAGGSGTNFIKRGRAGGNNSIIGGTGTVTDHIQAKADGDNLWIGRTGYKD